MSAPDVEDLPALVDAMRRKINAQNERIDELEATLEATRGRVAHLEEVVNPDQGALDWEQLTKAQKIYRVRTALVDEATKRGGKASMDYRDVRFLFDGQPSAGHAYNLMETAAELDGFDYDEDHDPTRVTVELDALNDETLIHRVNNAIQSEVA